MAATRRDVPYGPCPPAALASVWCDLLHTAVMSGSLHRLRWLVALVLVMGTPGLGELVESVVHAAVDASDVLDTHHETDDCEDACDSEGCAAGFFHTCRCNAPTIVPLTRPRGLAAPSETTELRGFAAPSGRARPAHRAPPFRPPSV